MTPDEIIVRGERAKNVATNPDYIQLLNDVATDVFNQFRKTNISDNDKREELHKVVFALDLLGKKFEKYQTEAKVELDKFIAAQAEKDK